MRRPPTARESSSQFASEGQPSSPGRTRAAPASGVVTQLLRIERAGRAALLFRKCRRFIEQNYLCGCSPSRIPQWCFLCFFPDRRKLLAPPFPAVFSLLLPGRILGKELETRIKGL